MRRLAKRDEESGEASDQDQRHAGSRQNSSWRSPQLWLFILQICVVVFLAAHRAAPSSSRTAASDDQPRLRSHLDPQIYSARPHGFESPLSVVDLVPPAQSPPLEVSPFTPIPPNATAADSRQKFSNAQPAATAAAAATGSGGVCTPHLPSDCCASRPGQSGDAYVSLLAGVDESGRYRGYLYNMLVLGAALKVGWSQCNHGMGASLRREWDNMLVSASAPRASCTCS